MMSPLSRAISGTNVKVMLQSTETFGGSKFSVELFVIEPILAVLVTGVGNMRPSTASISRVTVAALSRTPTSGSLTRSGKKTVTFCPG